MIVWIPDNYTEAHRSPERQKDLTGELLKLGVHCVPSYQRDIDLIFCGSIFTSKAVRSRSKVLKSVPVVHYNWDLYPWVVRHRPEMGWPAYLEDLKTCTSILVPNLGTAMRTNELVGRGDWTIVPAPVKVWEVPSERPTTAPPPGEYVLDVMRDYKWDRGFRFAEEACKIVSMPLVRTKTRTPWDEFRWLVANAKCLVSAVDEASTGGLTLLEGYAHGVPVVLTDSPLNGAHEYFGAKARYFRHDSVDPPASLAQELTATHRRHENGEWVKQTYSDSVFATLLHKEFVRCLNLSS